ncbi:MAG: hypothetical protein IH627_12400 [Rubrivivax sp.]|nr:hypothetical protein [Rubrivivax sp.]
MTPIPELSLEAKAAQQALLLAALRNSNISTIEAREVLSILHPAGRVMELRKAGWPIITLIRTVYDAQGFPHRSGVYHLNLNEVDE